MPVEIYVPEALIVTDAAREQYRKVTTATEPYLRLGLQGGGCSGFEFYFSLSKPEDLADDDTVVKIDNGGLVVDAVSIGYLEGSTVDWRADLRGALFIVSSPKAVATCGCGSSLSF